MSRYTRHNGRARSPDGGSCFASGLTRDDTVFWDPARCPSVIPVLGLATPAFSKAPRLRLPEHGSRIDILLEDGPHQHVLWRQGTVTSQLVVTGASVLHAPYLYTELLLPAPIRGHRLAAIAAFSGIGAPRWDKPRPSSDGNPRRLGLVLRALDGHLAGLSQREIATVLFGRDSVEAEWEGGAGYMRDRVRRAITRGQHLMATGYQDLLR